MALLLMLAGCGDNGPYAVGAHMYLSPNCDSIIVLGYAIDPNANTNQDYIRYVDGHEEYVDDSRVHGTCVALKPAGASKSLGHE